jgi:phosphatidylglycerol---prolipoprotein diacylglyceryl transferase
LPPGQEWCELRGVLGMYVHDLNPVLIRFTEQLQIRWYGMAYLAAFVVGAWLLEVLAKRKLWVLPPGNAGDFISIAAIFGVFVGGRLGYMLWYYSGDHGWGWVTQNPVVLFKVWEGGMASHGGILGLVIVTWFYSRKKKVSWFGLGDGLCTVAPLGLFFGRCANFINGELYGRLAHGVPWAMKFPRALVEKPNAEGLSFDQAMDAVSSVTPSLGRAYQQAISNPDGAEYFLREQFFPQVLAEQRANPAISRALEPFLEPRHPSQLYEAVLEGLVLFSILWWVRNRFPNAPHGVLTGLFFIIYAIARIVSEQFREPDAKMIGPMTSGQFLSLFMIVGGAAFLVAAFKMKKSCANP